MVEARHVRRYLWSWLCQVEWLAYPAAEALTLIVTLAGMRKALRIGNE